MMRGTSRPMNTENCLDSSKKEDRDSTSEWARGMSLPIHVWFSLLSEHQVSVQSAAVFVLQQREYCSFAFSLRSPSCPDSRCRARYNQAHEGESHENPDTHADDRQYHATAGLLSIP